MNTSETSLRADGGPAFPQTKASIMVKDGVYFLDGGGMTLRDWFAGRALTGMLANPDVVSQKEAAATHAYGYADAMLKARGGAQ